MHKLYPITQPYKVGTLKVSDLHTLAYEQVGNPKGIPVIFLHGGPGGGIKDSYRCFFDPKKWNVILFDQRGCGNSTPHSELSENTTWDLVADIEKLREHLKIASWYVFGGSWGSTLALSYGITHPQKCLGFILRGIFLLRKREIEWFYQEGASRIFPDMWEKYLAVIPPDERGDLVRAYHKRLTHENKSIRLAAAKAWSIWEASTSKLIMDPNLVNSFEDDETADAFARIECHYFINNGFFSSDNYLLDNAHKIKHLPVTIVQGRYDVVCPAESAWDLHKQLPQSKLILVPDAGHSAMEEKIAAELVRATDDFASRH
jgi:proline iminopeptidase